MYLIAHSTAYEGVLCVSSSFFLRFYCARDNLNDLMSFGLVCIYKVSLDILKI